MNGHFELAEGAELIEAPAGAALEREIAAKVVDQVVDLLGKRGFTRPVAKVAIWLFWRELQARGLNSAPPPTASVDQTEDGY
jgi:hypothetical protein